MTSPITRRRTRSVGFHEHDNTTHSNQTITEILEMLPTPDLISILDEQDSERQQVEAAARAIIFSRLIITLVNRINSPFGCKEQDELVRKRNRRDDEQDPDSNTTSAISQPRKRICV